MKRWMPIALAAGISLVAAGCGSSGTSETTVAGGTQTTVAATTVAPTTVAPTTAAPTTVAPTTVAPTTTAAPITTTTTTVYTVDDPSDPDYYPEPVQAGSDLLGSGCTPGAGPLPDGIWFGDLTNVGPNSFDFDLMCFAPNPPGSTYAEDGIGDITNDNPLLRTVPANTSAHVYVLDPAMHWMDVPYATWSAAPTLGNGCPLPCTFLQGWIYINGGEATEITMVWTP